MIYFFLPHVPAQPIGGVQTLFDYAERLNQLANKIVAKVVCPAEYIRDILPRPYPLVPVVYKQPILKPSDVLVFSEYLLSIIDQYPVINKKYVAVLNWKYFDTFVKQSPHALSLLKGLLTNSKFAKSLLDKLYPLLRVSYIPHVIEPRFKIKTAFNKRDSRSILILNRKNTRHVTGILSFLEQFPHTVTLVNNIDPDKLAELYNQHQIFVNLGYPEGFCRPAAEAMASGCVVVGFTGGGGNDFMKHNLNCLIAPDGDEKELIRLLSLALHGLSRSKLVELSQKAQAAITSKYTSVNQAKVLNKIFKAYLPVFTSQEIEKLYKVKQKRIVYTKNCHPLYAKPNRQTLELQLFNERQQFKKITSSKFYAVWQAYCTVRDTIRFFISQCVKLEA